MLRMFAESDEIVGLVSVGCCYMKLTTEKEKEKEKSEENKQESKKKKAIHDMITTDKDRWKETCMSRQMSNCGSHSGVCVCGSSDQTETTPTSCASIGYPLSDYVRSIAGHELNYEARELACHAIDSYLHRIAVSNPV